MKYHPKLYAEAFSELVSESLTSELQERYVKNMIAEIRRNGDQGSLKKIFEMIRTRVAKKMGHRRITLETARPLVDAHRTLLKDFLERNDIVEEKVSPEIIGGVRITVNGERRFDGSLKKKLDNLL